jgi:hypothetical protein
MAGLQTRLARVAQSAIVKIDGNNKSCFSYADDLKLITTSITDLNTVFEVVKHYLKHLGLTISTEKCKILTIGTKCDSVTLSGVQVATVHELKFLGLRVTSTGRFLPWRDKFTT